jgi:adenylate cyclase
MKKRTVICIDDDKSVLEALKTQIKHILAEKSDQYNIVTAVSGEEALEVMEDLRKEGAEVPLIISDQIMPGMKGDELLIKAAAIFPDTKQVLLTGLADAHAVGRAVNSAKLFRFIGKPWTEEALSLVISAVSAAYELPVKFNSGLIEESNAIVEQMNKDLESKISALQKFVPEEFLKALNIDLSFKDIKLGLSVERIITVMFIGMEFSKEDAAVQSLKNFFQLTNKHSAEIIPILMKNNGFVDKYIGNTIMALFLDTNDAMNAAIDLLAIHSSDVKLSIGMNVGVVRMGTVGDRERLQTTVIGDVVNVASRVQKLTAHYKSALLVTGNVINALKDASKYKIECLERDVAIKGKKTQTDLYVISQS